MGGTPVSKQTAEAQINQLPFRGNADDVQAFENYGDIGDPSDPKFTITSDTSATYDWDQLLNMTPAQLASTNDPNTGTTLAVTFDMPMTPS